MKNVLILIAAVFLLSGCGRFGGGGITENTTAETSAVTEEPNPYPITIDGVVINESPARIVCLSPSLCEILYEFREGERLVGRSGYCDYPPEIKNVRDLGTGLGVNVAEITEISPDLLLTSAPVSVKDSMTLESAGIKILTLPPPKSIEQFCDIYRVMGVMLYGAFTGGETGERVFSDISKALDNPNAIDMKNFVYITENLDAATGDTLESSVLSCFGNNLAKDSGGYVFDRNQLIANQPDVILLNSAYTIEDLLNDEVYSRLDAVVNKRVIIIDNACFERPSSRIRETIGSVIIEYNIMG